MTVRAQHVQALADFAATTRLTDVPTPVVDGARLLLLDTLGALVGGLRYPPVRQLATSLAAAEPSGADDAPFGRLATLGTASTWLDADSGGSFHPQGHRLPPVPTAHPAPHSLPVLLHNAATRSTDDHRLLEVFLIANEIGMRSGVASSLRPGMHPHGVHGPAASAVSATLLRSGTDDELARAFLLASALPMAATLAVPMRGGTVRNLWTGLGAYYGACAAEWAAAGAEAPPEGYAELFDRAICTDLSVDELVGGLGRRWQLANSYLKPYACARWIHPALDALTVAIADTKLRASDVESIEVHTFAFAASLDTVDIRSDMHARFSLPYCVAALLIDGGLYAGSFLPGSLERPEVIALARRVRVAEDSDHSAALPFERPARVSVRTNDGRTLTTEVRNARGNPDSPLPREDIVHKFQRNVENVLDDGEIDAITTALLDGGTAKTTSLAQVSAKILRTLAI